MEKVITLTKEHGKAITVNASGRNVAVIVWRKNGGVLLPLEMTMIEASQLLNLLDLVIKEIAVA